VPSFQPIFSEYPQSLLGWHVTTYLFPQLTQYQLITGAAVDTATLVDFLQITYREISPQQQDYRHLQATVDRYFSTETPLWFVTTPTIDIATTQSVLLPTRERAQKIACLWIGTAIDQVTGIRHPNIFLIYVDPSYRRQGIAKALMEYAQTWAKERGYNQIGLQVFTDNQPAIDLYQQLGYQPRAISMMREL
jgi:ribosomal protein S18 acetylase RimI-like enzyme